MYLITKYYERLTFNYLYKKFECILFVFPTFWYLLFSNLFCFISAKFLPTKIEYFLSEEKLIVYQLRPTFHCNSHLISHFSNGGSNWERNWVNNPWKHEYQLCHFVTFKRAHWDSPTSILLKQYCLSFPPLNGLPCRK